MYLEKVTVHGLRAASDEPLECVLPGRFCVIAGANASGKSTIIDSIVLAHRDVFPYTSRPAAAVLSKTVSNRSIDISYALEDADVSPLGSLCLMSSNIPDWSTSLSTSMGRVAPNGADGLADGQLPVLYLAPTRNPAVDLAGREARLIVELLRAQALRDKGDKSLRELRGRLGGLIQSVVDKWPVADAEGRVAASLAELTDGVAGRVPFLGTTEVDDTFLARVFEFLMATSGTTRINSHRLETEGLGYANLLQLAVVLAAIPDLTKVGSAEASNNGGDGAEGSSSDATEPAEKDVVAGESRAADVEELERSDEEPEPSDEELQALMEQANERREMDDDTFFANVFHAVVVLEEPEAHLHPQLQHGLIRYLKEVVRDRPEVQVILTTHSDEIVAACDPEDLIIMRRDGVGKPTARTVKQFGLSTEHLAKARRHLDVNRSASLFAQRAVLVEGITDAIVLRAVARVWAGEDRLKGRFVDALTISVVGSRVGRWLPELLTRHGEEIVEKLAVLGDTDGKPPPAWVVNARSEHFDVFYSDPTLEPSLVPGNELLVKRLLDEMTKKPHAFPTDAGLPAWVDSWFKNAGKNKKARFADDFAALCDDNPDALIIPDHLSAVLDFVWDGFIPDIAQRQESDPDDDGTGEEEDLGR